MKPLGRPVRASKFVPFAKKLLEDEAAAIGFDELVGALAETGANPQKVPMIKDKSRADIRAIRGMPNWDAADFVAARFKFYARNMGRKSP
jgi:hypothetical protein